MLAVQTQLDCLELIVYIGVSSRSYHKAGIHSKVLFTEEEKRRKLF